MNAPVRRRGQASAAPVRKLRCAVYTRKSSEEGLDMEFNSLDAQREACEAYVASQRPEGWLLVDDRYDDGGFSGGTLERPALKHLMADIERGTVDVIVVYKIDRLSRSLMDFAKLVEVFDRKGVTFVSVTQSFNTTTSMGRLTLNVLLSFAQFEREVSGERIRDKIAASRKKGMWMGGWAPLGYRVENRKLIVDDAEAVIVRRIFERFVKCGSATTIVRELAAERVVNRYGKPIDKGLLYRLLNNRVYIGEATHRGASYRGEHEAIIDRALWDKVHAILKESPRKRAMRTRVESPALLKGLLFGPTGCAMSPTHTRRRGRLYRYYVSQSVLKNGADACPIRRVPAGEIEVAVIAQLRRLLIEPEIVVATWRAARDEIDITEAEVRDALDAFAPLWDELFPAEQHRIVQLLVERADVDLEGLYFRLRIGGLADLVRETKGSPGASEGSVTEETLTVRVPLVVRKWGGRKVMCAPNQAVVVSERQHANWTLVKNLARAFRWQRMLESGEYATLAELANSEGVTDSYLSRVLKFRLMPAADIEAVVGGNIEVGRRRRATESAFTKG